MTLVNFAVPLVNFLWNLLPRRDQSLCEQLQYALHTFLVTALLLLVANQATHVLDVYQHAQQERVDALKLYTAEACATYNCAMPAKCAACSALSLLIQTWPLSRALIRVTHDWRLGLQAMVVAVTEHLQYKIALVLLLLALCSYAFKLFRCGKKKSMDLFYKKRAEATEKELAQQLFHKLNLLNGNTVQQAPYQQAQHV